MKYNLRNEMPVCGFAAVKTLEKINAHKIQRLYFTEERAPLFGGLCKKMAAAKKPYNKVQDPEELEKLSGTVHHQPQQPLSTRYNSRKPYFQQIRQANLVFDTLSDYDERTA